MDPLAYEQVNCDLRSEDKSVRAQAIGKLAEMDGYGVARMILSHARREDDEELLGLLAALARSRSLSDCADFIREQLEDASPREKVRILFVSQFVQDAHIAAVAAEHFGDADKGVTQAAWRIFGSLPKDRKIAVLGRLASSDDPIRRMRALRGFAKFRNAEVVGYLRRGLKDADYIVQEAAWDGLTLLSGLGVAEAEAALDGIPRPVPAVDSADSTADTGASSGENGTGERLTAMEKQIERGWICRTCANISRKRPDGKPMSTSRLWCSLIGKETTGNKTCPRGTWNLDGR